MIKAYLKNLTRTMFVPLLLCFIALVLPRLLLTFIGVSLTSDPIQTPLLSSKFSLNYSPVTIVFIILFALQLEGYHFKRSQADCYLALPFKPKQLRRIHFLYGLVTLGTIFFIADFFPNLVLLVKYWNMPDSIMDGASFGYFIALTLVHLLYFCISYGFYYFFISLGNRAASSISICAVGMGALAGFFPAFGFLLSSASGSAESFLMLQSYTGDSSLSLADEILRALMAHGTVTSSFTASVFTIPSLTASYYLGLSITLLLSVLSYLFIFLRKDPDGALSGSPKGNVRWAVVFFGLAFLATAFALSGVFSFIGDSGILFLSPLFLIVLFLAEYVVSLVYLGKAKLNKTFWIMIGASAGILLLSAIIFACTPSQHTDYVPPTSAELGLLAIL